MFSFLASAVVESLLSSCCIMSYAGHQLAIALLQGLVNLLCEIARTLVKRCHEVYQVLVVLPAAQFFA